MELVNKLEKMKGKVFMYNTRYIKILSYKIENSNVIIATDDKWLEFPKLKIEKKLNEFLPVHADNQELSLQIMPQKNEMANLKNIIMKNIDNVQKDEKFINQANTVIRSINTLINMAKLELSYLKFKKNNL